jgi:hypothetical protein
MVFFRSMSLKGDFDLSTDTFLTPYINLAIHTFGLDDTVDDRQTQTRSCLQGIFLRERMEYLVLRE